MCYQLRGLVAGWEVRVKATQAEEQQEGIKAQRSDNIGMLEEWPGCQRWVAEYTQWPKYQWQPDCTGSFRL